MVRGMTRTVQPFRKSRSSTVHSRMQVPRGKDRPEEEKSFGPVDRLLMKTVVNHHHQYEYDRWIIMG